MKIPEKLSDGLTVNALGEVFMNADYIGGSITRVEASAALNKPEHKVTSKDFETALRLHLRTVLPVAVAEFIDSIWEMQSHNDGIVRLGFYQGVLALDCEFKEFTDGPEAEKSWHDIYNKARMLGADVITIDEGKHLDCTIDKYGTVDEMEVYGKDHDRPYRQVAVRVRLKSTDVEEVLIARLHMKANLESIFEVAGVNVM